MFTFPEAPDWVSVLRIRTTFLTRVATSAKEPRRSTCHRYRWCAIFLLYELFSANDLVSIIPVLGENLLEPIYYRLTSPTLNTLTIKLIFLACYMHTDTHARAHTQTQNVCFCVFAIIIKYNSLHKQYLLTEFALRNFNINSECD